MFIWCLRNWTPHLVLPSIHIWHTSVCTELTDQQMMPLSRRFTSLSPTWNSSSTLPGWSLLTLALSLSWGRRFMLGLCADIVVLRTSKSKKLIVGFSRMKADVHPIYIEGDCVERVPSVKFLSRSDLQWSSDTSVDVNKAPQRVHLLRILRRIELNWERHIVFYRCSIGQPPPSLGAHPAFWETAHTQDTRCLIEDAKSTDYNTILLQLLNDVSI